MNTIPSASTRRTALRAAAILWCLPGLAALLPLRAAEPAKASCCADCADEAAAAPVSSKSIYQVDAVLADDSGRAVRLASFQGQPVVLAMFFTHCEYACPIIVQDMRRIESALGRGAKARFVLVSFDSERDTPEVLSAYRKRANLGAEWTLLHGDPADIRTIAAVLGVNYVKDGKGQFSHSNLITVLNPAGGIVYQKAGLQGDVSAAARAASVLIR